MILILCIEWILVYGDFMVIIRKSIRISSESNFQIINITPLIEDALGKAEIKEGIVNIFSKHSTTAICINEDEKGLKADFRSFLEMVVPNARYKHDYIDNNARSHLKSFLLSSSETIPIEDGKLALGTWQSVFFIELDGPRLNRTVLLTIIAD